MLKAFLDDEPPAEQNIAEFPQTLHLEMCTSFQKLKSSESFQPEQTFQVESFQNFRVFEL